MKGLWVDAGNDPVWEKINANGIRWLYFPLSDPPVDVKRRLLDAKAHGCQAGVYSAWNWYGNPTGAEYAHIMDSAIRGLGITVSASFPKVMFDDERHEPATIAELLRTWRTLRANQDTAWTLESMQGGWFTADLVSAITTAKVRVVPQSYGGADGRIDYGVDPLTATRDLTKRGIPDSSVSPFYDAARLADVVGWEGFAFTQGRLP